MFKLFRFYSIASGIAIIVATVVLVVLYRYDAKTELIGTAEGQNIALTRAFANTLWPKFAPYLTSISERNGDVLRARPETRQIHEELAAITAGLPVLKVKIYNLEGTTIFSSEPEQIGADKSNNSGFLSAARNGIPASKLSYRDTISTFEGKAYNRDLIESYIPIRGRAGIIEGVFELYTDVTPLVVAIDRITLRLMVITFLAFGILYGVLDFIVRRADRIMERQYLDLQHSGETITKKTANWNTKSQCASWRKWLCAAPRTICTNESPCSKTRSKSSKGRAKIWSGWQKIFASRAIRPNMPTSRNPISSRR